jgi:adenine-specific DNA-methyltransferase
MNKLKQTLEKILKKQMAFIDSESGEVNYIKIKDSADKIDKKLIEILISNKELKTKFFTKIKDVFVFNIQDFKFFLDESKIDNSYTLYANKIGLSDSSGLLENKSEVVLDFPFKDCVLEGGQSNEEGADTYFEHSDKTGKYQEKQSKRNEIFFNQVLAHDEIDRLYDKKALVNWKRFARESKKGGEAVKEIKRDKNGLIKENLIIKGNNLLALHSLKSEFTGKIKLIYIDPPYNTGGTGDTFTYNNSFKVSTWLTFMKNRLDVAQELLKDDGSIIVAIDKYMQEYLGVLLRDMFKSDKHEINCIVVQHNPTGTQGNNFSYTHEFAYFITPANTTYLTSVTRDDTKPASFRDWGKETSKRESAKTCFYPIYVKNEKVIGFGEVCEKDFHPKSANLLKEDGVVEVYPVDSHGVERKWRFGRDTVESISSELICKKIKGEYTIQRIKKEGYRWKTVWTDEKYNANVYGTKEVNQMIDGRFSYPKSLYTVKDCIRAVIHEKDDIILDYHAGSGTTGHAVLNLNEEDEGNRKFILIEQMDYIQTVTAPRIKEVLKRSKSKDDFIYLELAKWNEQAKEEINKAKDYSALVKLFDSLYEKYFLNYNLKIKDFKEKIIKEENFKKLSLAEQKRMFLTMLDLNQMYVQESEMSDKKFSISKEDQTLTRAFYKKK